MLNDHVIIDHIPDLSKRDPLLNTLGWGVTQIFGQ